MSDREKKEFLCKVCNMVLPYEYFGKNPPFTKNFIFLEEVYAIQDPFGYKNTPLAVGSHCSECTKEVCVDSSCSVFYSKRFCKECVKLKFPDFPKQLRSELKQNMKL